METSYELFLCFQFLDYASDDLAGYCTGGQLRSPTVWLGIFVGGYVHSIFIARSRSLTRSPYSILTVLMLMYRVRGAILIGIFLVSIISWPRPTAVTYFPHTTSGDAMFDYFKKVVTFQPLDRTGNVIDVSRVNESCGNGMLTLGCSTTMGTVPRSQRCLHSLTAHPL